MATPDEINARIAQLQDMAAAREGRPGFKENHAAIHAEITRLQMELRDAQPAG